MLRLQLPRKDGLRILCLGAHCDDIEIGCGATIIDWLKRVKKTDVYWYVFSSTPARKPEAEAAAKLFLRGASRKEITIRDFRDGFFPYEGAKIKEHFEEIKKAFVPDVIFTHTRHDRHQDHRLLCELTWNTFRSHLILEYEIPKYDGDLGSPNLFTPIGADTSRKKVDYLHQAFRSQTTKHWFTKDTFLALMRLRGVESNSPSGFAEAFYCRKLTLDA